MQLRIVHSVDFLVVKLDPISQLSLQLPSYFVVAKRICIKFIAQRHVEKQNANMRIIFHVISNIVYRDKFFPTPKINIPLYV